MRKLLSAWCWGERGASAAEFALILPALALLIFGVIHMGLMMYSAQQLNFAAEATARCMVVAANSGYSSATCYNTTGTNSATTYFNALYKGPTAPASFSQLSESPTCATNAGTDSDYQVVATANYVINAGFFSKTVPLTARACFPHS